MKPNPLPRLLHRHRWKTHALSDDECDKLELDNSSRIFRWYQTECRCGQSKEQVRHEWRYPE